MRHPSPERGSPAARRWPARTTRESDISPLELVNVLIRHRYLVLACTGVLLLLFTVPALVQSRRHTASASFIVRGAQATEASGFRGLAREFGIVLPTEDPSRSPRFYADVLGSRRVLEPTLRTPLVDGSSEPPRDLIHRYRLEDEPPRERNARALERLRDDLRIGANEETGLVQLRVTATDPVLAEGIARRMLDLLGEFALETRRAEAAAERRFVETRLHEARSSLAAAESELEAFLERNRQYRNSPQLTFEYARLDREVRMRQQVYTGMVEAYEQARIEEARNTAPLSLVEAPEESARPESRRLALKAAIGLFLGLALGGLAAFAVEFGRRVPSRDPRHYDSFLELRAGVLEDVRRARARLGRVLSRRSAGSRRQDGGRSPSDDDRSQSDGDRSGPGASPD